MSIKDMMIGLKTLGDAELVGLAREGDRQAFGELIQRHWHKCVDLGCCLLHNNGEAEDQAQNAFLKAYEHLDQYQGKARFTTWLLSIVANHCIMLLRARRRTQLVYLDEPSSELKTPFQLRAGGPDPENALACQQIDRDSEDGSEPDLTVVTRRLAFARHSGLESKGSRRPTGHHHPGGKIAPVPRAG